MSCLSLDEKIDFRLKFVVKIILAVKLQCLCPLVTQTFTSPSSRGTKQDDHFQCPSISSRVANFIPAHISVYIHGSCMLRNNDLAVLRIDVAQNSTSKQRHREVKLAICLSSFIKRIKSDPLPPPSDSSPYTPAKASAYVVIVVTRSLAVQFSPQAIRLRFA